MGRNCGWHFAKQFQLWEIDRKWNIHLYWYWFSRFANFDFFTTFFNDTRNL